MNGNNAARIHAGENGPVDTQQVLQPFVRCRLGVSQLKVELREVKRAEKLARRD
jgi:hypothetical protein